MISLFCLLIASEARTNTNTNIPDDGITTKMSSKSEYCTNFVVFVSFLRISNMRSYSLANLVAFYVGYAADLRRGCSKSLGFNTGARSRKRQRTEVIVALDYLISVMARQK